MKEMNPVLVKVRGVQKTPEGEENTIRTEARGRYIFRGGKHYVLYEEEGLSEVGKVSTTLKFDEEKLTLLRHGAVEQTLEFVPRRESRSPYRTPIGNLNLAVRTEFFRAFESDCAYGIFGHGSFCRYQDTHGGVQPGGGGHPPKPEQPLHRGCAN